MLGCMNPHDTSDYGSIFAELIDAAEPMPLGPGEPNRAMEPALNALSINRAFAHTRVLDPMMAHACLAGVWLLHGFLDESHRISQGIDTPTGSYWHAIMHRREPDYPNSKYWFARTGSHPIYPALHEAAAALADRHDCPDEAVFLRTQSEWDADAFVDLVEAVERGRSSARDLCLAIQQTEWQLLFNHSYRHATT